MKSSKPLAQTIVTDIWDAIETNPGDSVHMRIRATLMVAIGSEISNRELRQKDVAKILNLSQSRVSDLQRGWIDRFSIDTLVDIAHKLGLHVEMHVKPNGVDV